MIVYKSQGAGALAKREKHLPCISLTGFDPQHLTWSPEPDRIIPECCWVCTIPPKKLESNKLLTLWTKDAQFQQRTYFCELIYLILFVKVVASQIIKHILSFS